MKTSEYRISLSDQFTGKEALAAWAITILGIVLVQFEVTNLGGAVLCVVGGRSIGIAAERNKQNRVNGLPNQRLQTDAVVPRS